MSVDVILLRRAGSQGNIRPFLPNKPAREDLDSVRSGASDRMIGILGILGVGAIIGLSVYSVVRYLL